MIRNLCVGLLLSLVVAAPVSAAECAVDLKLREHEGSFQKFLVKVQAIPIEEKAGPGREANVWACFKVGWRDGNGELQRSTPNALL